MSTLPNPADMTHAERVAFRASLQPTRWNGVRHVATPTERLAIWRQSVTTRSDFSHEIEAYRAARGIAWLHWSRRRPIPRHRALTICGDQA